LAEGLARGKYASGSRKGQLVAPDIKTWFQRDRYQENPHIVAQWADAHNELATAWVNADRTHAQYLDTWVKIIRKWYLSAKLGIVRIGTEFLAHREKIEVTEHGLDM
jgi:hypothetical protein